MSTFLLPAQRAIYNRLNGAIPDVNVYGDPPAQPDGMPLTNFPYIVVADAYDVAWDTDDTLGANIMKTLHVWSRYHGTKEVKEIMGQIHDLLHRQEANLTAAGYRFVDCLFNYSTVYEEGDGVTRHGVCRYQLTVEKE